MKKNDFILICTLLGIGAAIIVCQYVFQNKEATSVVVTVDGEEYKTLPLDEDTELKIEEGHGYYNILQIKDRKVKIVEANCKNQVCVKSKAISKSGESIVCLPHKLIVKIVSDSARTSTSK